MKALTIMALVTMTALLLTPVGLLLGSVLCCEPRLYP